MIRFFRKLFKRGDFMTRADKAYYKYRAKTIFWSAFCLIIIAWVGTNLVLCALTTNVKSNSDIIYEPVKDVVLPTGQELNQAIKGGTAQYYTVDKTIKKITFGYEGGEYAAIVEGVTPETIDSDNEINLYRVNDGADVYVLSPNNMFANANSSYLFYKYPYLETIEFNNFNTSQVTNMESMFDMGYYELFPGGALASTYTPSDEMRVRDLDLSKWDVSNVTNMKGMFAGCVNFSTFNLTGWDTSKVEDMSYMFTMCSVYYGEAWAQSNYTTIDLSSFDTSSVKNMKEMFTGQKDVEKIFVSERFSVANVKDSDYMFFACGKLVGEKGTKCGGSITEDTIDKTYARIDGKNGKGFFCEKPYSGK